jgi:5-methylcytosine-specific restriction endonuclease McrA
VKPRPDGFLSGVNRLPKDRFFREQENRRKIRTQAWAETRGFCVYCNTQPPLNHRTMDHIIPKSKGGWYTLQNAIPACEPCNAARADRTPASEFVHWEWKAYVIQKEKALRTRSV